MFNDKRLDVSAPCAVDALVLSRVDANSTPLDHRPAELLRRKFFEARAYLTRVYDNWSVSRQNDAENFTEFVKVLSNGSSTYLYLSMCPITLYYALKCGRPDTDDEVLMWYVKTAPTGVMYDDEIDDDDGLNSERDQEPVLCETRAARPKPSSITLVYSLDSLLVLHLYLRVHLYKQRSNTTYSCSRLIKLAQATRAEKPASSNMAAQAVCESAQKDATKSIANFKTGFYRLFRISNIGNMCF
jgi:hypothetical protein